MVNSLINQVKKSKILYSLYYYVGSVLVNILKIFVKPDDKIILFVSFGGRHFNDSPKVLYDAMKQDKRFSNYKMIWAFRKPESHNLPEYAKVKIDTFRYFKLALQARCWITNVAVERALNLPVRIHFISIRHMAYFLNIVEKMYLITVLTQRLAINMTVAVLNVN